MCRVALGDDMMMILGKGRWTSTNCASCCRVHATKFVRHVVNESNPTTCTPQALLSWRYLTEALPSFLPPYTQAPVDRRSIAGGELGPDARIALSQETANTFQTRCVLRAIFLYSHSSSFLRLFHVPRNSCPATSCHNGGRRVRPARAG